MVSCSHQFVRINLTNNLKKINLKKNSNFDEEEDLEKPTVLEMYMVRTKSEVWDSSYEFEMVKHNYGLFDMSLYDFAKTFYVRNKKSVETRYHLKTHIKNNQVIMFTPVLSTDPEGENYHEFCRLNLIKFRPFVDSVENAYDKLTDGKETIKMWEQFSKNLLESGKVVPGNLRRDFERVAKYNAATNKNNENEKNNYLEDFEEPDDSVLN